MFQAPPGATGRRAAFTLLELLAVVSIIAVLAGIVLGVGRRAAESGKTARAKAELAALAVALEHYRQAYGDFPRTDDAARLLQSLLGWRGPANLVMDGRVLLESARFTTLGSADPATDASAVLIDAWGRPYRYAYKTPAAGWTNPAFILYSVGPDGQDSSGLLPGGFADPAPQANADNLYANRP